MPANLVDERGLMSLQITNLFGARLNLFQSGLLLYLALAVVLTALCWLGWRRNEAGKGKPSWASCVKMVKNIACLTDKCIRKFFL